MFPFFTQDKLSMMKVELTGSYDFPDEEYLPDDRASLSPSEVVQSKLLKLLPNMAVPISCMHIVRDTRRASVSKA